MRGRQGRWWLWALAGLVALAALAGIILAVWKLPSLLYGDVTQASADARLQAASGFRTAFVAGLAGIAALGSLAIATRTYRLTQQGQITDRYTRAIEQLGSEKQDVRLGGIYALERIANDSAQDRATIVEVLTAFVRGHAPWPPEQPGQPEGDLAVDALKPLRSWAPDVQAALTVLGRRKPSAGDAHRLDFETTDLRHADLLRVDLRASSFAHARLQKARLTNARLQSSWFLGAVLQHAILAGAQLHQALLIEADLQGASLERAELQAALLYRANLAEARLQGADLSGATLTDAHMEGAQCNSETVWPDQFDWRAAGVILKED
jgi:hypothetical protein